MEGTLELFARMLEYPGPDLPEVARECERRGAGTRAREALRRFRAFVEAGPAARLEEAYTAAFDLDPAHCPYAGYHLFGDGTHRIAFLQQLKARYRACGLETGGELADHFSALLRYAAACPEGPEREEILQEAILPALKKIVTGSEEGTAASAGYGTALAALVALLEGG
jgi:nitrate reductase molybdenum cofactor assembly chaperone NarJ/NarW